jgi:hypothetical protein
MEIKITPENLTSALKKAGHKIFSNDKTDYNLNIIGIRCKTPIVNKFNDLIVVAWKHKGEWTIKEYTATTLAGLQWLKEPMNPKGCAILKEGRYSQTWKIAFHRNKYAALCQRKPVTVYRDHNKDAKYDLLESKVQTGLFGINIHRASKYNVLDKVDRNSAGCQVFQSPKDFNEFMLICRQSRRLWGDSFTYTLINESDFPTEKPKVVKPKKTVAKKKVSSKK